MKFKKALSIIFAVIMFFSLYGCKNKENNSATQNNTTEAAKASVAETATHSETPESEDENTTESATDTDESTALSEEDDTTASGTETTIKKAVSPSDWSKEQIVDVYKKSAKKSHSGTKSAHKIKIKKISVNNGEFEGLFDFIMPIMSKLLANNSEDKDGITGGYNKLTTSDVASAKAYKSGKNTVIEMVMKEQVSGPKEDADSGSVGHAITAVGDISVVTKQLADLKLPLEISDEDTKIYYTNPTVKVVINENGKIINGTWQYTVEIRLDNYKAFGQDVETTSVIMDNILTVNGGFNK